MSGERSKWIGELGEKNAASFFKAIGWGELLSGIDLPCLQSEKHQRPAKQHGLDALYSAPSPLHVGRLDLVLCSVKNTGASEPLSDAHIRRAFKADYHDLTALLECFERSELRAHLVRGHERLSQSQQVGVLLWLNKHPKDHPRAQDCLENMVLPKISGPDSCVFLVDQVQVDFVCGVLMFLHSKFPEASLWFDYPETGLSSNEAQHFSTHGTALPVEYINSPIIPLRVQHQDAQGAITYVIATLEGYTEERFKRLLGLGQTLTRGLNQEVLFLFSSFSSEHDQKSADMIKQTFVDRHYTHKVKLQCYNTPLEAMT